MLVFAMVCEARTLCNMFRARQRRQLCHHTTLDFHDSYQSHIGFPIRCRPSGLCARK